MWMKRSRTYALLLLSLLLALPLASEQRYYITAKQLAAIEMNLKKQKAYIKDLERQLKNKTQLSKSSLRAIEIMQRRLDDSERRLRESAELTHEAKRVLKALEIQRAQYIKLLTQLKTAELLRNVSMVLNAVFTVVIVILLIL